MFTSRHYVPVLRWKRGEQRALRNLAPTVRASITPLLEPTPRQFEEWDPDHPEILDQGLAKAGQAILESWGSVPCFLDTHLIGSMRGSGGAHPTAVAGTVASARGLKVIHVARLGSSRRHRAAVRRHHLEGGIGCAVRLVPSDFTGDGLEQSLRGLLDDLQAQPSNTDLMLDLQLLGEEPMSFARIITRIPEAQRWRSFTILGGSFPKDLTGLKIGNHLVPRLEWRWWSSQTAIRTRIARRPAFGDYTTQHAIFTEPPKRASVSASVRYTLAEHWLVMRGESVLKPDGPGYKQWPAHAQLLCKRNDFAGRDFSVGDAYIHERSRQPEKTGSAETWLCAGVNHHLTYVTSQIASLRVDEAVA